MKKNNFIEACMHHYKMMLLFIITFVALGAYAIYDMPKREFPDFVVRQGVIAAVYPGATAEQVEEQVAKPLEEFMFTYKEVRREKTYTTSKDGMLIMMVELNESVMNKDEVWSKIKHGLIGCKQTLPTGVLALIPNDDFGDTSALLITLESEDKTYRELEEYLTTLENRLRRINLVSNLRRYGIQKEQISLYINPSKLAAYSINQNMLMSKLMLENTITGGAYAANNQIDIPIHVTTPYSNEFEIAEQIIATDNAGNHIRVKDVAEVVREYNKPNKYITNNGKKAIILSMEAQSGENVVEFGKEVDKVLAEFQQELPQSVTMQRIADLPKIVDTSVTSFLRDLMISIAIVVIVMLILFSFRSAMVAATSIPISIFITIAVMYLLGIELNTVTLAILVLVLGMIVDNSVIVIDAYIENLDKGLSRWHAAIASAKDYFASILLATLCLCSIFVPFLFTMTGLAGDFISYVPSTFTIALSVSLIVAMVFIPFMEFVIIRKGNKQKGEVKKKKFDLFAWVQKGYEIMLRWIFAHSKLTLIAALGLVILGGVIFANLPQRMMPLADRDQFAVEIYLPQGSAIERTEEVSSEVYDILKADSRVKSITSFVGMGSPRFHTSYAPNPDAKNYAQFIVNTESNEATVALLNEYTNELANKWTYAYVKLKQMDYSVTATPIEIRLRSEDITQLRVMADSIMLQMKQIDGLVNVHTNYEEMMPSINVSLDPVVATQIGVSHTMLANELAMKYGGMAVGSLWEGNYPLNIVLKTKDDYADDAFNEVGDEYINTFTGQSIPLRQVSTVEAAWRPGQIVRRNGIRTITIMADIMRGYNEGRMFKEVNKMMQNEIAPILPNDVKFEYGGTYENDQETGEKIPKTLAMSFVIIFIFLLINFRKISIALTALGSILLCIPGAALGLWIFGFDFGLTSVLGITALLGINVRNAIIMFEHAENLHHNEKWKAKDAAFDAGKRRMVPIFLTSATTAVGVVPMIVSGSTLWAPLGAVICIGTVVSMLLVVTVLPVMYWKIYGNK